MACVCSPISAAQFREYNSAYRGGLAIVAVRSDSPAARQGIRQGDILVGMHKWETISLENVTYILSLPELAQLDPIKFYIIRGSETWPLALLTRMRSCGRSLPSCDG
ncbi:MAG: PDZ domain-containing protein [Planctomycetes bacterium]|nr:PDZ domain-containing protein [Planctomycetota bacterium]